MKRSRDISINFSLNRSINSTNKKTNETKFFWMIELYRRLEKL